MIIVLFTAGGLLLFLVWCIVSAIVLSATYDRTEGIFTALGIYSKLYKDRNNRRKAIVFTLMTLPALIACFLVINGQKVWEWSISPEETENGDVIDLGGDELDLENLAGLVETAQTFEEFKGNCSHRSVVSPGIEHCKSAGDDCCRTACIVDWQVVESNIDALINTYL